MPFNKMRGLFLSKTLTVIADIIARAARRNASWSSRIPGAISVESVKGNNNAQTITIKVDGNKAPHAVAFELGSGIHDESTPKKYMIAPRNAPRLVFPIERWPNYVPPPYVDVAVFPGEISGKPYVMHPGVAARPYLEPAIRENLFWLTNKIADTFLEVVDEDILAGLDIR